jgi:hypothetical protein
MCDGAVKFISENIEANPIVGNVTNADCNSNPRCNYLYQNLFNINDKFPISDF